MRVRAFAISILAIAVSAIGVAFAGISKDAVDTSVAIATSNPTRNTQQQPTNFIDGSRNPELIPDHVAYTLVFRLLSDRYTPEEQGRARSYLKMVFGCLDCNNQTEVSAASESHINSFLNVVAEFEQRVSVLDHRAQEIHDQHGQPNPPPDVLAELDILQRQKEAIVAELIASLPSRLGADGAERLHQHINNRVKPKTKIGQRHIHAWVNPTSGNIN